MTVQRRDADADPLYARPLPERPAYATGMMLGADDFADEQTYHRGRLARALAQLAGGGTLAGLRVAHVPASGSGAKATPEELRVEPGVAVDRLGRLIELPRAACLRLGPWFDQQAALQQGDNLRQARHDGLAALQPLLSARRAAEQVAQGTALPASAVVADVYLRFIACARGWTPSFASGPYDALDAVAVSRLRDAYELLLVARRGLSAGNSGLPLSGADFSALGPAARGPALQDAVFNAYPAAGRPGGPKPLPALAEHPSAVGFDTSAVFLARVLIPLQPAADGLAPQRDLATPPQVDNYGRRFLPALALIGRCLGL